MPKQSISLACPLGGQDRAAVCSPVSEDVLKAIQELKGGASHGPVFNPPVPDGLFDGGPIIDGGGGLEIKDVADYPGWGLEGVGERIAEGMFADERSALVRVPMSVSLDQLAAFLAFAEVLQNEDSKQVLELSQLFALWSEYEDGVFDNIVDADYEAMVSYMSELGVVVGVDGLSEDEFLEALRSSVLGSKIENLDVEGFVLGIRGLNTSLMGYTFPLKEDGASYSFYELVVPLSSVELITYFNEMVMGGDGAVGYAICNSSYLGVVYKDLLTYVNLFSDGRQHSECVDWALLYPLLTNLGVPEFQMTEAGDKRLVSQTSILLVLVSILAAIGWRRGTFRSVVGAIQNRSQRK